ncbi:MAG: putative lactoylglutathione lyase [Halieaceae bacterium]|jgi:predicted lactoylglutathione lyase
MIGYVTIGVSDMARAKAFYCELLKDMGATVTADMERIAFIGKSMSEPMIAVCLPYDEQPNHPGNGNMVAIAADNKENVDKLYHKAIELGATCDGEPGQRIPDVFYGAYVRDLDGNKLAFYIFGG